MSQTRKSAATSLVKLVAATGKHWVKTAVGNEALAAAGDAVVSVVGDEVGERLRAYFETEDKRAALLEAGRQADLCYKRRIGDDRLRQVLEIPLGNLPSIQTALDQLTEDPSQDTAQDALRYALQRDFSELNAEDLEKVSKTYFSCLEEQLLKLADLREVITGRAVFQIRDTTIEMAKDLKDVKQTLERWELKADARVEPAPAQLRELLQRAEANNPGVFFEAVVGSGGTAFVVGAKAEPGQVEIGRLGFPNTEGGQRGLAKYRRHLDEGGQLELLPDEFEWHFLISPPSPMDQLVQVVNKRLVITPKPPSGHTPVRLEVSEDKGGTVATIDLAEMRCTRVGRREMALEISGGTFAGTIGLVLSTEGELRSLSSTMNLNSQPPHLASKTLGFIDAIKNSRVLSITPFALTSPLIQAWVDKGTDLTAGQVEGGMRLLKWLTTINNHLELDLRYPEETADDESWHNAELLGEGLEHGIVEVKRPGSTPLLLPRAAVRHLLDATTGAEPVENIAVEQMHVSFTVLGKLIELDLALVFMSPTLLDDPEVLEQKISAAEENENIRVHIGYRSVRYNFSNITG